MQNFLFFKYARLKGYKFDLTSNEKSPNTTGSKQPENDQKLIFASYKGKIVGAVQLSGAIMPETLLEGASSLSKVSASQQSLVISYFFINTEEGLRRDIVTTGLLLKLQSYAKETNKTFCVGYSYNCFCEELRNTSMTFFNVNYSQIFKCSPGLEDSLKDKVDKHLRLENPFIWNTCKSLLSLSMSKRNAAVTALPNAA